MNANWADQGGPAPMDVGNVGAEQWEEWSAGAVNANTRCYNCGGFGHIASQCREKGKGKGGKGKGKDGKGGGREVAKGKSKGYLGTCWTCGKVGHKAWECRQTKSANGVEDNGEEEEEEEHEQQTKVLGGIWKIGAVDVVNDYADEDAAAGSSQNLCTAAVVASCLVTDAASHVTS